MVSKTANIATKKLKSVNNSNGLYDALEIEETIDPGEWVGLPSFEQKKNEPGFKVIVSFRTKEDLHKFADLIQQPHLKVEGKRDVKSIWYPPLANGERGQNNLFVWVEDDGSLESMVEENNDE